MRILFGGISLLLGLGVTMWLMAASMGGGGSGVAAPGVDSIVNPTAAIGRAEQAQSAVALKQGEMMLQACAAQNDGLFTGCTTDPQVAQGVTVQSLTASGFVMRAGDLTASYDSGTQAMCHATVQDPANCQGW